MVGGQHANYIPPDEEPLNGGQAPPSYTPLPHESGFDSELATGEASNAAGEPTIPIIT